MRSEEAFYFHFVSTGSGLGQKPSWIVGFNLKHIHLTWCLVHGHLWIVFELKFFFSLPFFLSYMQIGRKIMDNLKKAKQKFSKDLRARIERMVTKGAFASEECWEWKGATRAPDMAGWQKSHFLDFRKLSGLTGHHIWPSTKSLIYLRTSPYLSHGVMC